MSQVELYPTPQNRGEPHLTPKSQGEPHLTPQSSDTSLPLVPPHVSGQHATGDAGFDTSLNASTMLGHADVLTPVKDGQQGRRSGVRITSTCDGVSQTDPVTIIIGDASFLVKKLKSSAINPSKVGGA